MIRIARPGRSIASFAATSPTFDLFRHFWLTQEEGQLFKNNPLDEELRELVAAPVRFSTASVSKLIGLLRASETRFVNVR